MSLYRQAFYIVDAAASLSKTDAAGHSHSDKGDAAGDSGGSDTAGRRFKGNICGPAFVLFPFVTIDNKDNYLVSKVFLHIFFSLHIPVSPDNFFCHVEPLPLTLRGELKSSVLKTKYI